MALVPSGPRPMLVIRVTSFPASARARAMVAATPPRPRRSSPPGWCRMVSAMAVPTTRNLALCLVATVGVALGRLIFSSVLVSVITSTPRHFSPKARPPASTGAPPLGFPGLICAGEAWSALAISSWLFSSARWSRLPIPSRWIRISPHGADSHSRQDADCLGEESGD